MPYKEILIQIKKNAIQICLKDLNIQILPIITISKVHKNSNAVQAGEPEKAKPMQITHDPQRINTVNKEIKMH